MVYNIQRYGKQNKVNAARVYRTDMQQFIVNISSSWLLPEEGFPVFYRYFRDRITWFEADAVCQFHHAQLVTVDSSAQYDAARAYLKELDVTTYVWIGLKRANAESDFTWTDYKGLESGGYWAEALPTTDSPVCAALDPAADFRWHPLNCGGPEVASFICQLEVPVWAKKEDGCMLTSLPSLTVTFLPEQSAVELISDCGLEGTRRIACKGQANREEMIKQLSCETSTEATSSGSWDNELPTRHRRDTEVTPDMASEHSLPTTEGLTEVDIVNDITAHPPSSDDDLQSSTTLSPELSSQVLPQEMSAAEEPIRTSIGFFPEGLLPDDTNTSNSTPNTPKSLDKNDSKHSFIEQSIVVPVNSHYSGITSEESSETNPGNRRTVILTSNKPIPPSLRGNSPFIEVINITSKVNGTSDEKEDSQTKPIEKESHEVFRESNLDNLPPEKTEVKIEKGAVFPPLSVYTNSKDQESEESSIYSSTVKSVKDDLSQSSTTESSKVFKPPGTPPSASSDDTKFFTRINTEESDKFVLGSTSPPVPDVTVKATTHSGTDNDFLFIVTENPVKAGSAPLSDIQTVNPSTGDFKESTDTDSSVEQETGEGNEEGEPEAPERPNRGRLLVKPQRHSFYPYFLNRVLG
ncbi:uncharacterized protein LOC142319998 [Lycorma delicatula]|uniref:uncharacterized protein LOC142319998 n=1 Tax=Lycorma delicatula TaxID=130591 RepID=UPI003F514D41